MNLIQNARAILILAHFTGLLYVIRAPILLIVSSITPFSFLFFIYVIGGGAYLPYGLAGALTSILVQAGLTLGSDATFNKVFNKYQDICVASPVSAVTYMLGLGLGEIVYVVPSLLVLILLASLSQIVSNVLLLTSAMFMTWIFSSSIGFFVSTYVGQSRSIFSITSVISSLLTIFPPVFYPIQLIPESVRWVAYTVPTTNASLLIQSAVGLNSDFPLGWSSSWLILLAYTALFLFITGRKAQWRQR